ncbi:XRE family transcriptional regulator [Escherichia coli]|uniref:XRE family transcriptional regulator n=1 Tax=Escherichia coli TaxID=562 RepID=UPI0028131DB7|nr:XRE family transcriptional regulator [Escherichia coli]MDQ9357061.1 XRE family transcriptional regulator [Escherichia coli]MDQ9359552.1 XRE family transcriptional regulator [Escherichia coli]
MKDITNIAVTGEDGVVTYADGSKEEFQCSGTVATIIASLATTLEKERKMRIATGDRLRRMYTRDSDMISRGLNGTSATTTAPIAMNAEFMRLVRAVAPKYDSALPDADPRIVALDVLRYAPAEAFSAVHPTPMSEIQLDQAIDILEQVGDYMKANNIAPKIISTGDAIRSINADNATFWGKKH